MLLSKFFSTDLAQVLYIFFVISSMTIYTFLVLYLDVSNQIGLATDEKSGHKTIDTFLQVLYRDFNVSDEKNYVIDENYWRPKKCKPFSKY